MFTASNIKKVVACGVGVGVFAITTRTYVGAEPSQKEHPHRNGQGDVDEVDGQGLWNSSSKTKSFIDRFSSSLRLENAIGSVLASWTNNFEASTQWDNNWDRREPNSMVKPKKLEGHDAENELLRQTSTASRHLFFIRHGQYEIQEDLDKFRILTPLGREQAKLTGQRLKDLGHPYTVMVNSTMTRAIETANIIAKEIETKEDRVSCDLIREGAPYPPEPPVGNWRPNASFFTDGARIEAGFRKHLFRAPACQKEDSYEVIVCHANVIRYFFCRALQLPPEAWLRLSLHHASITWMTIRPNGRVSVRALGDCGHMPPEKISVQ